MRFKLFTIHFLSLICWLVVGFRLFQLQILPNDKLESKINGQFASHITVRSKRGDIYDRNGNLLATSVSSWSAFIDPQMVVQKDKLVDHVSAALKINRKSLYKKLSKKNRFVWLKRKLTEDEYNKITRLQIRGLSFVEEYKRIYFAEDSLGFLVGKVDIDGNGLSGLELQYDHLLSGKPLKFKSLRDGKGRPLIFSNESLLSQSQGESIHLNLDLETQVFFNKALKKRVDEVKAKRGWGLIVAAETGEIISSVQVAGEGQRISRNNIAVSEVHEPGSVLKTFSFLKAASELKIKPSQTFECGNEGFKIGRRKIRNSHKEDCSKVNLVRAFSKSLNTVSAELALELGEKKLVEHYKDLGLSKETGVDFPGEAKPIFYENLSGKHHLASLSFGHGVSLTSMQIVQAYTAFSGKGSYVTPKYLSSNKIKRSSKIYRKKDLFLAKALLSSVVSEEGTGHKASVPGYLIGGKTGTSEKIDFVNGGYTNEVLSSFIGVYPLSKPKYIAMVVVDEPETPRSGGAAAGPVFSKVVDFMLRKNQILPDKLDFLNIEKLANLGVKKLADQKKSLLKLKEGKVPDLRGYSLREAFNIAKTSNLKFKIRGHGQVDKVLPDPGKPLPKSKVVILVLK